MGHASAREPHSDVQGEVALDPAYRRRGRFGSDRISSGLGLTLRCDFFLAVRNGADPNSVAETLPARMQQYIWEQRAARSSRHRKRKRWIFILTLKLCELVHKELQNPSCALPLKIALREELRRKAVK